MELLLIRHGLPQRVDGGDGFADPGLDAAGVEQANRLADHLRAERIDAIYASSMRRAQQTAQPLAEMLGLPVVIDPAVAENDVRASHYIPQEELRAAGDPRWRDGFSASEWPDYYEPLETFHERIVSGLEAIMARHRGEVVAVFCHGGVIARYTASIVGQPWESTGFFYPHYTSITRLTAASTSQVWMVTANETPHLRGTNLPTGGIF
jgi:broad specificity phosphatase PhoE